MKERTRLRPALLFCLCGVVTSLQAADRYTSFVMSGYLDGSYNYLVSANQFVSEVYNRAFDLNQNGPTLQQAALTIDMLPSRGLGAFVNLIAGKDAFIIAAYGYSPFIGNQEIGFDVTQAWLQYTFSDQWNIKAGKFVALAGHESISPVANKHFSRSELFTFATPLTVTGLRSDYQYNDKWKMMVGVNAGWDTINMENSGPTGELGLFYSPSKKFEFSAVGYLGQERVIARTDEGPIGGRGLIDLVAQYQWFEKILLALDYVYGSQHIEDAVWQGVSGYVVMTLHPKWKLDLRGEIFDDQNGYRTGVPQTLKELTVTLCFYPKEQWIIRAETRRDVSNVNSFINKSYEIVRDYQQSFAVEAVYLFLLNKSKTRHELKTA